MPRRAKRKKEIWFWEDGKALSASMTEPPASYSMEIKKEGKRTEIFLSQTKKILKYSEEEIQLLVGRGRIACYGKRLCLSVFRAGTVEISGMVEKLLFGGEEHEAFL